MNHLVVKSHQGIKKKACFCSPFSQSRTNCCLPPGAPHVLPLLRYSFRLRRQRCTSFTTLFHNPSLSLAFRLPLTNKNTNVSPHFHRPASASHVPYHPLGCRCLLSSWLGRCDVRKQWLFQPAWKSLASKNTSVYIAPCRNKICLFLFQCCILLSFQQSKDKTVLASTKLFSNTEQWLPLVI